MIETVRLERIHTGEETTVYQGDDGGKYLLRVVNRDYSGARKPPVYYLLRGEGNDKPSYVSGLFETGVKGVLSGDVKDEIGVRRMFTLTISEGGALGTIEPRKPRQTAVSGACMYGGVVSSERGKS